MTASDKQSQEVEQLMPDPWWKRVGEKAINAVLIIAIGVPVAISTGEPLYAALVGAIGLTIINVAWWRLVKKKPISEVYDALKPWV